MAQEGDLWDSEICLNSLSLLSLDKALSRVCVCVCLFAVSVHYSIKKTCMYQSFWHVFSIWMFSTQVCCRRLVFVSRVHGVFCVLMFAVYGCMCVWDLCWLCVYNAVDYQQTVFLKGSRVFVVSRSRLPTERWLSVKVFSSPQHPPIFLPTPFAICLFHLSILFLVCSAFIIFAGSEHLFAPIQLSFFIFLRCEITSRYLWTIKSAEDQAQESPLSLSCMVAW